MQKGSSSARTVPLPIAFLERQSRSLPSLKIALLARRGAELSFLVKMNLSGIVGIALGFASLRWRKEFHEWIGPIGWAEKFFGAGGTHTALILTSILLIIGSVMHLFGGLGPALGGVLFRFFPTPSG